MADKEVIGQAILKDVRLSFADIYKPAKDRKDKKTGEIIKGKFGCSFLIPKKAPIGSIAAENLARIKAASTEAKTKKWGANPKSWPNLKPEKLCLRDGSLEAYDGYQGMWYLASGNDKQPQVITNRKGKDKKWMPAVEGTPNSPYSGCYVNGLVRIWVQDNEHGKRLNASLEIVQFLRDGDAFSATMADPNDVFGDDMVGDVGDFDDEETPSFDDDDDLV